MKSLASLHCATQTNCSPCRIDDLLIKASVQNRSGFVLPSVLGMIGIIGIASAAAFNISATQIRIIQSEKQYLYELKRAETQLVNAEKQLIAGLDASHLASIETFKPKYFRNKSGITTHHYRLTTLASNSLTGIQIQSTLRIDEHHTNSETKAKKSPKTMAQVPVRHVQRLSWTILSD